jgi:general secretion pathway protein L
VKFASPRLGLLLQGERLVAVAIDAGRVEAFALEAESPAAALRAELDQRKIAARTVAIGLPRASVTVKPIDLPAIDGEVGDMVRFELERHVPYASEDPAFDFAKLPAEPGQGGAAPPPRVVIAAADRRVIDGTLRVAEDLKLRPVSITVGVHNLPALTERQRRGRVLWIHRTGEESADLLFLSGSSLVLSRHLPSADDARLVSEAQLSFGVTRWSGCDAIWVSGDGVAVGAPTTLTDVCPSVMEPPWNARARRLLAGLPAEHQGAMQIALAVAEARGARPLELLPVPLRPRRLTRGQMLTGALVAACAVLAVTAALVPGYRETQRLAAVNQQIAGLDREVRAVEQTLKEVERKRRLLKTIETVESTSVRALPVLRELTDTIPNDAWLTLLSLDLKGVELTGQANAASGLIPLLENSPRFERVEFSSPVTRGRDREQFRIRAAWEGGPGRIIAAAPPAGPAIAPPVVAPAPPPPAAPPGAVGAPPARGRPQVVTPPAAVSRPPAPQDQEEEDDDEEEEQPPQRPRRPITGPQPPGPRSTR